MQWLTFHSLLERPASGRIHAARVLLQSFALDVTAIAIRDLELPDEQDTEHIHWNDFFAALDAHTKYLQIWSERKNEL